MLFTPLGQRIVVRFARKPIWYPTAPSKLFRIAEHNFYDEEEINQIRKLYEGYNAQMSSIHKFMDREFYTPALQAGGLPSEFVENEKIEDQRVYEENNQINADVAKRREAFFANLTKKLEESVVEEKLVREEALLEAAEKVDEFIRRNKSDPECFVTPDNFDVLIEKIIDNPVSYEFCIDKQGRKIDPERQRQRNQSNKLLS